MAAPPPGIPVRNPAGPCARNYDVIPVARLPEFSVLAAAIRWCRACGHESFAHVPPPPAAVVAAAAAAQQQVVALPAVAPPGPVVPLLGPLRASRVEQFSPSGLAFLSSLQLWRAHRLCSDDTDAVAAAFEVLESAWFHGANEVANFFLSSTPPPADISVTTTFEFAPIPDDLPAPAAADPAVRAALQATARNDFRRRRSRETLQQLAVATAILRIARAYARRRQIVDHASRFCAVMTEEFSDEWHAIREVEARRPVFAAQSLDLAKAHYHTIESPLWWFLAAASMPLDAMALNLERIVEEYGVHFRAKNPTVFVPRPVWDSKYSAAAIARKRPPAASTVDRTPRKRDRDEDTNGTPPGAPTGKQRRRREYRERRRMRETGDSSTGTLPPVATPPAAAPGTPAPSVSPPAPSGAASGASPGRGGNRSGGRGGRGRDARGRNSWRR